MDFNNLRLYGIYLVLLYIIYALRQQKKALKDIIKSEQERGDSWKRQAKDWIDELKEYREKVVKYYKDALKDMKQNASKINFELKDNRELIEKKEKQIEEYTRRLADLEKVINTKSDQIKEHLEVLQTLYLSSKDMEIRE
jgi:chromosome segregation ATPase